MTKRNKVCKKGKCQPTETGTACTVSTGRCDPANYVNFVGSRRWAQTFLPPRGGQLTAAEFFLTEHSPLFELTAEIRTVDGDGVPTDVVLSDNTVIIAAGSSPVLRRR